MHGLGAFTDGGHDDSVAVLTHDITTMACGISTIEAVARAVHKDLSLAG
ncbi:hypothetical protein [Actinacidiphila glaucinigra]